MYSAELTRSIQQLGTDSLCGGRRGRAAYTARLSQKGFEALPSLSMLFDTDLLHVKPNPHTLGLCRRMDSNAVPRRWALLLDHAAVQGIEAFTSLTPPTDVFGTTGHLVAHVGLAGLYPLIVDRTPTAAKTAESVIPSRNYCIADNSIVRTEGAFVVGSRAPTGPTPERNTTHYRTRGMRNARTGLRQQRGTDGSIRGPVPTNARGART